MPSVAELHLPTEPPAKRRRTDQPTSPKRSSDKAPERVVELVPHTVEATEDHIQPAPTDHNEKKPTLMGIAPIEQIARTTKKVPRARRKLFMNDEVEQSEAQQTSWETRTAGLEDTFIFGLKPKKQQPKPKTEEADVADESKQKMRKNPRVKKTTKAKEQLEDKLEPDHIPEPAEQIEKSEKKSKTSRKKTVASKSTAPKATEVNNAIKIPIDNGADHGSGVSDAFFTAAESLSEESVNTELKPAKTKPACKRALERAAGEVVTAVESMNTATPERPTKRPRRQAAISAIEKVVMGYEDELIPVDKLRRAPDVGSKPRKPRKVDVPEPSANAPLSPPLATLADSMTKDVQYCSRNESPSSTPLVVKRGRKPGVKAAQGRTDATEEKHEVTQPQPAEHLSPTKEHGQVPDDEKSLPPKLPAKRGRKPGSKNRKVVAATSHEEPSVESAVTGLALDHLSPAQENKHSPDDEPTFAPKQPAKRGRKPGLKNRKVVAATNHEEPTVEPALAGPTSDHPLSARENKHTLGDEPTLAPKLPAKRGRKPGAKNRQVTTDDVEPPVESIATELAPKEKISSTTGAEQPIDSGSEPQVTRMPRNGKSGALERLLEASEDARSTEAAQEASKHSRSLAKQSREPSRDSSRQVIEKQPTKQRRALADFDGNIVRKSLTVEGKKLVPSADEFASPPRKQQSRLRKTKDESVMQSETTTVRSGKAQQISQFEYSQNEGPSHETTATPKRRRAIATDDDLDWLFEKPKSRRREPATIRQPATKTRQMATEQSAKDMDLDDLLATVAGFSGKLLTGRRARVVAS